VLQCSTPMSETDSTLEDRSESARCADLMAGTLIVLALLPSWIGLLGGFHWFLDLFSHPRWQYLAICVLAVAWTAWRRQRRVLLFAGTTLLLNGFLIGNLAWHPEIRREKLADDFSLSVLSLNVYTANPNKQQVLDHVREADADVVFLMEVNSEWVAAMEPLKAKYPHSVATPREDNFGVALFSRIPWKREETFLLGRAEVQSVEIEISHAGHDLRIIGTHPLPPVSRDYAAARDEQLRLLAQRVAQAAAPTLVVGDLNATPWSAGMRIVTKDGKLGFRSLSPPWIPTWRADTMFAIPIDHALCTKPLVITQRKIGPDVGSDHRSVRVTVGWEKQ
jgi:endonuclease/exonuclease/phosphatase (EEP) superfamily protein YafD